MSLKALPILFSPEESASRFVTLRRHYAAAAAA
jgi:hypothetical protein